jgi:hypothetical protein
MRRWREIGIGSGGGRWWWRGGRGWGFVERIGGNVGDNFCHWELEENPNEWSEFVFVRIL